MNDFLQRLKQRQLVQWAAAYLAAAWVLLQVLDLASDSYGWPHTVMHIAFGVFAVGFVVMLVLAWYHGERGVQRVLGMELLIVALILAVGGGLLWHFSRTPATAHSAHVMASAHGSQPAAHSATTTVASKVAALPRAGASSAAQATTPVVAQPIPAKSVAVLPFENLSADKNNAYFADGMQDLILTKLADIGDLKVISRTSTEQYGSHPGNLRKIARELGVATVLEGSVQKSGKQVLINVQLINAKTDSHIWAKSYQRTLTNIFGVEGEVASKVAQALNARLSAAESREVASIPTTNPQAYKLYLQSQYEMDQYVNSDGQPKHLLQADAYLTQAIAHDPQFAAAYAALARTELVLRAGAIEAKDATLQDVQTHAEEALALKPDLADAHLALSRVLMDKADFNRALQELQTAARLAPNDARVYSRLATLHLSLGDWQQAVADSNRALRLDPRSGANYDNSAWLAAVLRHYSRAKETLEQGLAINPDDQVLRSDLGHLLLILGHAKDALAQFAKLPLKARGKPADTAHAWMLERNYAQALKAAELIPQRNVWADAGNRGIWVHIAAQALGDGARAKTALERARKKVLAAIRQHPDALHGKLAYIDMLSGNRTAALQAIDKVIAQLEKKIHQRLPHARPTLAMELAPNVYEDKAEILAHFGDAARAVAVLGKLFETQGTGWAITPAMLRLDPVWDPIRHDPRFQALLKKYGKAAPSDAQSAN